MENRKLLFFDVDGTLLTEDTHSIPESTILGLQKAKEKGHLIFINTGRPLSTIMQMIKDLPIDGFVCGCGTYVEYHNQTLYEKSLSQERCLEIVKLITSRGIEAILEGKNAVYFTKNNKHPFILNVEKNYQKDQFCMLDIEDPTIIFDKFTVWFDKDVTDIEEFQKHIPDFTYIDKGPDIGEVVPKECSKATGIQFLSDYFNIPLDNCYVFGDSSNDESMLFYVKHAIVMGNGAPYLFDHAYYVTKDIHDDGIYHALEYLQLI